MSAAEASRYQQLRSHLTTLKLTDAAEALPAVLDAARAENLTLTAALERLLRIEVTTTEARRLTGRLRFACLPTAATLEDFDYDAQPGVDPHLINDLASCRYLQNATKVLMIGPPGVGKTMLAVGLARKAAEAGYHTYFTTAADLAARCHRAAIEGRWATTMRFYAGPTLLVIDEFLSQESCVGELSDLPTARDRVLERGCLQGRCGFGVEFFGALQCGAQAINFEFSGCDLTGGFIGFAGSGQGAGVAGDHPAEHRCSTLLGLGVVAAQADEAAGAVFAGG